MTDQEIIDQIKGCCEFQHQMEEDRCVAISFHNPNTLFESTLRNNPHQWQVLHLVSKLPHLRSLNLRKARVNASALPFATRSLEVVDVSCNYWTTVPAWLMQQSNLRELNIGANLLSQLPTFDAPLTSLKAHKNPFAHFGRLPRTLKLLNVYMTGRKQIPDEVFEMPELEILSFGMSTLDQLPAVGQLQNLRHLMVSICMIDRLPEDITTLKKLKRLIVAKNKLDRLPESIGELTTLTTLSLYRNCISHLPESFYNLPLSQLNLAGNPLADPRRVQEVFGRIPYIKV